MSRCWVIYIYIYKCRYLCVIYSSGLYTEMYLYTYVCIYIHIYVYTYIYLYIYIYIYIHIHVCIHMYVYISTHMHVHIYVYIYIYIYIHTYIHINLYWIFKIFTVEYYSSLHRGSHRKENVLCKKTCSYKFCKIHRNTPVRESFFK